MMWVILTLCLFSRQEFQSLLLDLNITFSRKKWILIFKEIDRNFDDEVFSIYNFVLDLSEMSI